MLKIYERDISSRANVVNPLLLYGWGEDIKRFRLHQILYVCARKLKEPYIQASPLHYIAWLDLYLVNLTSLYIPFSSPKPLSLFAQKVFISTHNLELSRTICVHMWIKGQETTVTIKNFWSFRPSRKTSSTCEKTHLQFFTKSNWDHITVE